MVDDGKVGEHYGKVVHVEGPKIYTSQELYDAMYELGGFTPPGPFEVLDAMCGAGLVGKEMAKRLTAAEISHTMYYADVAAKHIQNLQSEGNKAYVASVFTLPFESQSLDRVYARFGVKNYPKDKQMQILSNFRNILRSQGIFVLTDMEAPADAYEFMQEEGKTKHHYTGLDGDVPHMPTLEGWKTMLSESGLTPREVRRHMSYVTTSEWVKSNQMTAEALNEMNKFLLSAPENARKALNIREENGDVKIDYPVVIIAGHKE